PREQVEQGPGPKTETRLAEHVAAGEHWRPSRTQGSGTTSHDPSSVYVNELVGVEQGEAQFGQGRRAAGQGVGPPPQKPQGVLVFRPRGGAAEGQVPGTRHDVLWLVPALLEQPPREGGRLFARQGTVEQGQRLRRDHGPRPLRTAG